MLDDDDRLAVRLLALTPFGVLGFLPDFGAGRIFGRDLAGRITVEPYAIGASHTGFEIARITNIEPERVTHGPRRDGAVECRDDVAVDSKLERPAAPRLDGEGQGIGFDEHGHGGLGYGKSLLVHGAIPILFFLVAERRQCQRTADGKKSLAPFQCQ